jgi:uncharacterized protein YecA (UPF0149 family)
MTKAQTKKEFEKYNSTKNVVRCPSGRAKMRKPLDIYAKAAVNLYGIIRREELAEIFNAQNTEQTTAEEIYTILLPNVLKFGWYGFYKDYIVHYAVLRDFEWVSYLEKAQSDKPRYIPPKKQFVEYEWEEYEELSYWQDAHTYMLKTFGCNKKITDGFYEIKNYLKYTVGLKELGAIMQKYDIVLDDQKQAQEFFDLFMLAANNTRKWQNKGYTPQEMKKQFADKHPKDIVINKPKEIGPNEHCPCGSGKKYKKCCAITEASGTAQISHCERKLFYETWYKLLNYVNQKHSIINIKIKPVYPSDYDEAQLFKIREKLWANPQVIGEFVNSTDTLSDEETRLLQLWEKSHIKGQFILVKYEPKFAVLMQAEKDKAPQLYAVKGMTTSIAEAMHRKLPVILETVLLPLGDKIIYDSYMISHDIRLGDGIRNTVEDEYIQAKDMFGIKTKL